MLVALLKLALLAPLALLASCGRTDAERPLEKSPVTVFAAASLTDVITALADQYQRDTGFAVTCSFASSSTLARQIQAGAPADIFLSASAAWMDTLESDGVIQSKSRVDLLGNALVIISPANDTFVFDARGDVKLERAFTGRLAIGDPDHVPAGAYARQALVAMGSWNALAERAVFAGDVRGALLFVERREVEAGIVYRTDARISDKVRIVVELPAELHDPIAYPAAMTSGASDHAEGFFNYLRSDAAAAIFRKAGFVLRLSAP